MVMKRATCWIVVSSLCLAVSAVAEPTRRIKGLQQQAQRRVETENNKQKQPGILRAFGGVVGKIRDMQDFRRVQK
jgi:hypothetical protein